MKFLSLSWRCKLTGIYRLGMNGEMKSPKPKLSRNTSTFRDLRVTEEDEEGMETISAMTHDDQDDVAVPKEETNPKMEDDRIPNAEVVQAEPFVLPGFLGEPTDSLSRPPSEESVASMDKNLADDGTGNDSGIASSSNEIGDDHTAFGLSMPTLDPSEREPWQRILWKQQEGYDDDYVPESFLRKEREMLAGE
jgi:hypothetical protein